MILLNTNYSEIDECIKNIEQKKLPEITPGFVRSYFYLDSNVLKSKYNIIDIRSYYIENVGFSFLSDDWITKLAKFIGDSNCLEIMAGSGALTYSLRNKGVNIIATDDYSWGKPFRLWTDVINMDAVEAINVYGENVDFIICSWPYMDDTAYKVLLKMRKINKSCKLIYIGENEGGCTASDLFFENITILKNRTFYKAVSDYISWQGIHDSIFLIK